MGLQEDKRIHNYIKEYVKKENILRFQRNCPYRNSKKNRFYSSHNLYWISQFINRRTDTGSRRITDKCTTINIRKDSFDLLRTELFIF
ncbi:hypothetical protein MA16_Dca023204 [Dendrobium catenatum]|uniref:Uncharacterized protein n=1 Tax=Dendrobium catenatum TaxID=906689 RepID=A0A2I0VQ96_9ASPA|nr:hypothetical protein MA16_Dca023204 [Dendrobium catenatum]